MANIYSFLSWQFWFFAVLTGIALFVTFYAAGSSMIRRFFHVRSAIVHVLLAAVLGMVMWGIQGWVFGFLHVRWLSYIYVLRCILLLIVNWQSEKKIFTQLWQEIRASDRFVAAFILFGSFLQLFSVFGSGLRYTKGVEFFRANSVDGILHLSYIQEIAQHFPPNEPGEFGLKINHYHFWSDLVLADLARVWQLPISHLFFQFIPIFISIFTGVAVYVVARSWKGSRTVGLWALFFLYFGSDAAYLFMLFFHHQFGFQTAAIDNGMTQFLNTPHTFAKLVFCTALFPFQKWLETHKKSWGVLTTVLFGCLVGFKVYFGIFAGLGLVFLTFAKIGKHVWTARKSFHWKTVFGKIWHEEKFFFLMVGVFVVMSALIYFPVNKGAGGLFYSPLEWPKIFLGKDNIDWEVWWQRKMIYEAANNIPEIVLFDLIAIFICLVSVYGTRLVGLFPPRKLIRSLGWEHIAFLWPPSILFIFLGLYTLQNSGLFNVFNFFAVSTVVFALFAAFVMGELQERREKWTKILLVLVIVLTLPRPIHEVFDLLSLRYESL